MKQSSLSSGRSGEARSARLVRAYRRTVYRANGTDVRIGSRSDAVRTLLLSHRVRSAVLLTAWNPMSRRMPLGLNRRMQRSLRELLRRSRLLPAEGSWRAWREEHVMLLGQPARAVVAARVYRQRAVVIIRQDGYASLRFV